MRRLVAPSAALLALGLAIQPSVGMADWLSGGIGSGSAKATQVETPTAPTAASGASTVSISWAQVKLANGDPVTGYAVRRYVGGSVTTICTTTEPVRSCTDTAPAPGTADYTVTAVIGLWTSPESNRTSVTRDATAPVTTLTSNPAPNPAGWNRLNPTITLNAADTGSGVKSITYTIGGGAPVTVNGASASFPVSTEGSTQITYRATDNAGNVEALKTYTVKLDKTAPATTSSVSGTPNAQGFYTSNPTVSLSATDGGSGVASVTYAINGGAATTVSGASASFVVGTQGANSITFHATDQAGNDEPTKTLIVKVDSVGPVIEHVDPAQGRAYEVGNNGTGSWAKTCNSRAGICAKVTSLNQTTTSVSYTLTKAVGSATQCWNAATGQWVPGTACSVAMVYDASHDDYFGGVARTVVPVGSYSVTINAVDALGRQSTSTVTFTTV